MEKILLAVLIGGSFGFVLDRIGATNPANIIHMLRLTRLQLMKTILFAIGIASVLMFSGLLLGLIDPGHMSVKAAYMGVFVGGLSLGAGFALAGYCPGTSLAAAATGRKDALFFIAGGLVGAAAYMLTYSDIKATGLLDKLWGGKVTLGEVSGSGYGALLEGLPGEWIGLALGVVLCGVALILPDRLRQESEPEETAALVR